MGLVAPWHVGSSWTRARTHVPCIGRRIPNHCATREAHRWCILIYCFLLTQLCICSLYFCCNKQGATISPAPSRGTNLKVFKIKATLSLKINTKKNLPSFVEKEATYHLSLEFTKIYWKTRSPLLREYRYNFLIDFDKFDSNYQYYSNLLYVFLHFT